LDGLSGTIIPFLFVLMIIVFFHELGHYLVGRVCGVQATVFSIGFGPELFGFDDKHGTRWRVSLLPLGGYVRFLGDLDSASFAEDEALQALPEAVRRRSFPVQSVWKRFLIVLAGPVASILLGVMIFSTNAWLYGRVVLTPRVAAISAGSAAESAGFQIGDLVVAVNGERIESFTDLQRIVGLSAGVALTIEVDRGGQKISLVATPRLESRDSVAGPRHMGMLGISARNTPDSVIVKQEDMFGALAFGWRQSWTIIASSGDFVAGLFSGRASPDQVSGPVGIAKMSGEAAKLGFTALIAFAGMLSVSIGALNLLPIPLLDGGHLVLYVIEAVRGKALEKRAIEAAFRIGLAFVVALTLFSLYVDLFGIRR
jgi:regulator of sigma E protease